MYEYVPYRHLFKVRRNIPGVTLEVPFPLVNDAPPQKQQQQQHPRVVHESNVDARLKSRIMGGR